MSLMKFRVEGNVGIRVLPPSLPYLPSIMTPQMVVEEIVENNMKVTNVHNGESSHNHETMT